MPNIQFYSIKSRKMVDVDASLIKTIVLKNGRPALEAIDPETGTEMFKIASREELKMLEGVQFDEEQFNRQIADGNERSDKAQSYERMKFIWLLFLGVENTRLVLEEKSSKEYHLQKNSCIDETNTIIGRAREQLNHARAEYERAMRFLKPYL